MEGLVMTDRKENGPPKVGEKSPKVGGVCLFSTLFNKVLPFEAKMNSEEITLQKLQQTAAQKILRDEKKNKKTTSNIF